MSTELGVTSSDLKESGLTGYVFPYNNYIKSFDVTSYNPSFSEGVITMEDIDALMMDVNSIPEMRPVECGLLEWLFIIPVFVVVGGFLVSSTEISHRNSNVLGFLLYIYGSIVLCCLISFKICCMITKRQEERRFKIKQKLSAILIHHQETTFRGKNSVLTTNHSCSAIFITFKDKFTSSDSRLINRAPQYTNYPTMNTNQNEFRYPSSYFDIHSNRTNEENKPFNSSSVLDTTQTI